MSHPMDEPFMHKPYVDGPVPDERQGHLFEELRKLCADVDPIPEDVVAAGHCAFIARSLDEELALLVYDSGRDGELVGVRSATGTRQLTFETGDLTLELEVATGPAGSVNQGSGSMVGQLVPPCPGTVEVRHPGGSVTVAADRLGRFSARGLPSGPMSLRCRAKDGTSVLTEWILV